MTLAESCKEPEILEQDRKSRKNFPEKGTRKKMTADGQVDDADVAHLLLEDRTDGQMATDGLADVSGLKNHDKTLGLKEHEEASQNVLGLKEHEESEASQQCFDCLLMLPHQNQVLEGVQEEFS